MSTRELGVVAKRVLDRAVFIATAAVYPPCRDSSSSAEEREAFRVSYWSSVAQFDQAIQLSLGICPFAQPLLPASAICLGEELVATLSLAASTEDPSLLVPQVDGSSSASTVPWVPSRLNSLAVQFIAREISRQETYSAAVETPPSSVLSSPSSDSLANVSTESPPSSCGLGRSDEEI